MKALANLVTSYGASNNSGTAVVPRYGIYLPEIMAWTHADSFQEHHISWKLEMWGGGKDKTRRTKDIIVLMSFGRTTATVFLTLAFLMRPGGLCQ